MCSFYIEFFKESWELRAFTRGKHKKKQDLLKDLLIRDG